MDAGNQRIVDERLIVTSTCGLDKAAKIVEDSIVDSDGNLGLARAWRDDRTSLPFREIDVSIGFSRHFAHIGSFDWRSPSMRKSAALWPPRATHTRRPGDCRRCSGRALRSAV